MSNQTNAPKVEGDRVMECPFCLHPLSEPDRAHVLACRIDRESRIFGGNPCANIAEKNGTCAQNAKGVRTAETVSVMNTTEPTPVKMNIPKEPQIKLYGPSGDGCHVEVDGEWFAFGNTPENAWKAALRRALMEGGNS